MLITSATPGADVNTVSGTNGTAASNSTASSTSGGECVDVPAPGSYSCVEP